VAALIGPVLVAPTVARAAPQCSHGEGDTLDYQPWAVKRIAAYRAWPISQGSGVTVAVLDSGVNAQHRQLAGRVEAGVDLVRGTGTADTDCNGHGSMVAGIIAGKRVDGSGFYGVAPEATILPIRIAEDTEKFDNGSPRIAAAIRYAVDHDATVINMSLTTDDSPQLRSAVAYAHQHDVVLVAATGNAGHDTPTYPASYPDVIAVGGIDSSGDHDSESETGDWVDLAAPSTKIVAPAGTGSGYGTNHGTSFAAPVVAGTAALIRSYRPDLTPDQVATRLEATADHPVDGHDDQVGYGVVNPYRAVTQVLGEPNTAATTTGGVLPAAASRTGAADPVRTAALWAAVGLLAVVLALLLLAVVVPAGRRRGWRPGLRGRLPGPRSARRQPVEYDPTAPPPIEPEPPATTAVRLPGTDSGATFTVDVHLNRSVPPPRSRTVRPAR
jgi:type VII secretion-associated serine protease mycosin